MAQRARSSKVRVSSTNGPKFRATCLPETLSAKCIRERWDHVSMSTLKRRRALKRRSFFRMTYCEEGIAQMFDFPIASSLGPKQYEVS